MPPKVTTTKEMIFEAAFKIVRTEGLKELSSRNLAKRLNCSISPVFTAYEKMSDIEDDVMKKAADLLLEYATKDYTENPFLNQGVGIVIYARDNKQLYKELFMEGKRFVGLLEDFGSEMSGVSSIDEHMQKMTPEQSEMLMTKMWIFAHGLAALACVGLLKDDSEEFIIQTLYETGRAVISDTLSPWKGKGKNID